MLSRNNFRCPPIDSYEIERALDVLDALVSSELAFSGLSRLLVEWSLVFLPARACSLLLRDAQGRICMFEGVNTEGGVRITDKLYQCESEAREVLYAPRQAPPDSKRMCSTSGRWAGDAVRSRPTRFPSRLETSIEYRGRSWGRIVVHLATDGEFRRSHYDFLKKLSERFGFLLHHRLEMDGRYPLEAANRGSHPA